ncbi:MAG TPA: small, acid-soluble spore protein, alpha/beta type [Clostridium sp.]
MSHVDKKSNQKSKTPVQKTQKELDKVKYETANEIAFDKSFKK